MVVELTVTTTAKNRLTFKRTARAVYLELQRPGSDENGARGWLVVDGYFLSSDEVQKLRDLLMPAGGTGTPGTAPSGA